MNRLTFVFTLVIFFTFSTSSNWMVNSQKAKPSDDEVYELLGDEPCSYSPVDGVSQCDVLLRKGLKFRNNGNVLKATDAFFRALGPNAAALLQSPIYKFAQPDAMILFYHASLLFETTASKPATWPSIDDRQARSDKFVRSVVKGSWFESSTNQVNARNELPPMSGDVGVYEFVTDVEDPLAFASKYFPHDRPVVVGAGSTFGEGSWALLQDYFNRISTNQPTSRWSKESLVGLDTSLRVSSIAYPDGGSNGIKFKPNQRKKTKPKNKKTGLNLWDTTVRDFVEDVMLTDTFENTATPDLQCAFRPVQDTIEHFDLNVNYFPEFMGSVFKNEEERDCSACPNSGCWCAIQFYLGPAMSGSQPHTHRRAWNLLVRGRKRWFVFAPLTSSNDIGLLSQGKLRKPAFDWIHSRLPKLKAKGIHPMEFEQLPGELVFVPEKYPHVVLNLEPSIGFAVETTHVDSTTTTSTHEEL